MRRYAVISADCHAGADLRDYRPYLASKYHEDFDRWADSYVNPFGDLLREDANRNWDDTVRNAALEADGIVAEIIFPNTVPPFFTRSGLVSQPPTAEEYESRLAGLRAHNRWLADFCGRYPGRRAGIGQMLLNDIDEAVRDIHWIADTGLTGGVLLSAVPPNSALDPLHAPTYDPIWRACEERGVLLNVHGGGGGPDHGAFPGSLSIFVLEASFYAHRPLWALIMSGVFDRFPGLRLAFTEAGSAWLPGTLAMMDSIQAKQEKGNIGVLPILEPVRLQRRPSEYWHTNCWLGASFMTREDALDRHSIGVDRIMWGSDFPHDEGTFPYTREALAHTFAGMDRDEVAAMVGGNAAHVYGFDLALLQPIADRIGPDADTIFAGIDSLPDSTSMAFEARGTGAA